MDVTPLVKKGQQIIQSYAGGVFKINGVTYQGPVYVFPEKTLIWNPQALQIHSLVPTDFDLLVENSHQIDVFLLGCGAHIQFLPANLKSSLKSKGLSPDVMDTGAACRTYNVLMAEGRRVVCALLPV